MKELYNEGYELLNKGESFVLATLYNSKGSAPRTAGARMIVKDDLNFNKVYNPIGLEINAGTPEEIAISIAAELIKVRGDLIK
ncbi:XdhC family protein [Tepidibacter sp. Z1-5]|uniref:XdhC family protein n=1 Tax=Tepidibacter sp. Z1-5 TaxID=3134138 RepID=UPI0030BB5446